MDAGRRTMSALKTSEGGKSSRPDGCSTHCGAQCGALLYPFDRSSASTDDSAARSGAMQGGTMDVYVSVSSSSSAIQVSPYFDPTYTRTGWIGQPPVLDRHEVVTIGGDVVTLRQATP